MRWDATSCESLTTKDKAQEEESESVNGNKDNGYLLEEI